MGWLCDWGVPGTKEASGAEGEKDVEGDMMQALVALDATQMMVGPGKWAHRLRVHRLTWISNSTRF